ncbi:PREDICTED: uncharacterized protein LOC106810834 [Priapulus caudatus]|uniref:Uncharacterized protein LOC106810834 n=1 Tax=Priapulus caudatus TaxID=37621 RepID=A0ABM1EC57_PRICU|nr:PREDICTED: uncharacterized protein LOC106810834 [Priapulus caudatus]
MRNATEQIQQGTKRQRIVSDSESENEEVESNTIKDAAQSDAECTRLRPDAHHRNWSTAGRKRMQDMGMYARHDMEHLAGFEDHLRNEMKQNNSSQTIQDVARYMHYINPGKFDIKTLKDVGKTKEFFAKIRECGLSDQTVLNYQKGIKKYLDYLTETTDLYQTDKQLYENLQHLKSCLCHLRKGISRGVTKEVNRKKYDQIMKKTAMTPEDLQKTQKNPPCSPTSVHHRHGRGSPRSTHRRKTSFYNTVPGGCSYHEPLPEARSCNEHEDRRME